MRVLFVVLLGLLVHSIGCKSRPIVNWNWVNDRAWSEWRDDDRYMTTWHEKEKFLEVAKSKFIELQEHWSSGDFAKLENFCTEELMNHLSNEFKEEDKLCSNLSTANPPWSSLSIFK